MQFTVGGEVYNLTQEQVLEAMAGVTPEVFREHIVEMNGTVYPPKQVFAQVTGRPRSSFTTMEAQRVLTRLGFVCRRAGQDAAGRQAWIRQDSESVARDELLARIASLEARVDTTMTAVAGLASRVQTLEAGQVT